MPRRLWKFLESSFGGADFTLQRQVESRSYFRTQYAIFHDNYIKVLILPRVDKITTEEALRNDVGKPIKVYFSPSTTFQDIKERIVRHLNETTGSTLTAEDVHLWKPDFKHTLQSRLLKMIIEMKSAFDQEQADNFA